MRQCRDTDVNLPRESAVAGDDAALQKLLNKEVAEQRWSPKGAAPQVQELLRLDVEDEGKQAAQPVADTCRPQIGRCTEGPTLRAESDSHPDDSLQTQSQYPQQLVFRSQTNTDPRHLAQPHSETQDADELDAKAQEALESLLLEDPSAQSEDADELLDRAQKAMEALLLDPPLLDPKKALDLDMKAQSALEAVLLGNHSAQCEDMEGLLAKARSGLEAILLEKSSMELEGQSELDAKAQSALEVLLLDTSQAPMVDASELTLKAQAALEALLIDELSQESTRMSQLSAKAQGSLEALLLDSLDDEPKKSSPAQEVMGKARNALEALLLNEASTEVAAACETSSKIDGPSSTASAAENLAMKAATDATTVLEDLPVDDVDEPCGSSSLADSAVASMATAQTKPVVDQQTLHSAQERLAHDAQGKVTQGPTSSQTLFFHMQELSEEEDEEVIEEAVLETQLASVNALAMQTQQACMSAVDAVAQSAMKDIASEVVIEKAAKMGWQAKTRAEAEMAMRVKAEIDEALGVAKDVAKFAVQQLTKRAAEAACEIAATRKVEVPLMQVTYVHSQSTTKTLEETLQTQQETPQEWLSREAAKIAEAASEQRKGESDRLEGVSPVKPTGQQFVWEWEPEPQALEARSQAEEQHEHEASATGDIPCVHVTEALSSNVTSQPDGSTKVTSDEVQKPANMAQTMDESSILAEVAEVLGIQELPQTAEQLCLHIRQLIQCRLSEQLSKNPPLDDLCAASQVEPHEGDTGGTELTLECRSGQDCAEMEDVTQYSVMEEIFTGGNPVGMSEDGEVKPVPLPDFAAGCEDNNIRNDGFQQSPSEEHAARQISCSELEASQPERPEQKEESMPLAATDESVSAHSGFSDASPEIPRADEAMMSLDVLLCLDASFAVHAPLDLAFSPVASWDSDAWDAFGQHLRSRADPCRLDSLGLDVLDAIGVALGGLDVGAHFCGQEESETLRLCPLDVEALGRRWKRTLLRDENLWTRVADDVDKFRGHGLQSIVVIAGGNSDLHSNDNCARAYQAVGRLALAGLPVHVVTLGAPLAMQVGSSIAAATGGSCIDVPLHMDSGEDCSTNAGLRKVVQSLRALPRPQVRAGMVLEDELHDAARILQRAIRSRQYRSRRRLLMERKAVARITSAYSKWRLHRCVKAAAQEAQRARKRAPVEAALQRRRELQYDEESDAAARRIQLEWRSRRIRLWCQRADREARRLQRWTRRRWLRQRLERQVPIEQERLKALRRRLANAPPVPPSQRSQQSSVRPVTCVGVGQVDAQLLHAPKGSSAMLACPPPLKKPSRPRSHSSCAAVVEPSGGLSRLSATHPAATDQDRPADPCPQRPGSEQYSNTQRSGSMHHASSYRAGRGVTPGSGCVPPGLPAHMKKVSTSSFSNTLPRLGPGSQDVGIRTPRVMMSPRKKHDAMM
jgi:hypothetical protein